MRIWNEQLIPKLCQKHICGMWRESLGAYKIIQENRTDLSYWKHPATQEFVGHIYRLWQRLKAVRDEMLKRGYHPKELPECADENTHYQNEPEMKEWQTIEQQIEILRSKGCKCMV